MSELLLDIEDECYRKESYENSAGYFIYKRNYLHRYLLGFPDKKIVDHINGNRADNRKENLRICSPKQNSQNSKPHKDNKYSSVKGVSYLSSGKRRKRWRARIYIDGQEVCKYFSTGKEAIYTSLVYQKKYHKDFMYYSDEQIKLFLGDK